MTGWNKTSRQARGYGAEWDRVRLLALERDCHLCQPCKREGRVREGNQVDHIRPKARGGSDDLENLEVVCGACHTRKNLRDRGHTYKPKGGDIDGNPTDPNHPWNK